MPEDTAAEMEYIAYEAGLCPGCGNPVAECMDKANEKLYETEAIRCFACQDQRREAHKGAKEDNQEYTWGLYYRTRLIWDDDEEDDEPWR